MIGGTYGINVVGAWPLVRGAKPFWFMEFCAFAVSSSDSNTRSFEKSCDIRDQSTSYCKGNIGLHNSRWCEFHPSHTIMAFDLLKTCIRMKIKSWTNQALSTSIGFQACSMEDCMPCQNNLYNNFHVLKGGRLEVQLNNLWDPIIRVYLIN